MWICQLTWHFPILLDAATAAVIRKGDGFMARWADIMTGITYLHLAFFCFATNIYVIVVKTWHYTVAYSNCNSCVP